MIASEMSQLVSMVGASVGADWQTGVSLLIVFAAVAVFLRKIWSSLTSVNGSSCGSSCSSCPASETPGSLKVVELVQLDRK